MTVATQTRIYVEIFARLGERQSTTPFGWVGWPLRGNSMPTHQQTTHPHHTRHTYTHLSITDSRRGAMTQRLFWQLWFLPYEFDVILFWSQIFYAPIKKTHIWNIQIVMIDVVFCYGLLITALLHGKKYCNLKHVLYCNRFTLWCFVVWLCVCFRPPRKVRLILNGFFMCLCLSLLYIIYILYTYLFACGSFTSSKHNSLRLLIINI